MKIFTSEQIRQLDELTIRNEPVSSVNLMERAAAKIFNWIIARFDRDITFHVFAGPGNNGGDGLALSRLLLEKGYQVDIYYISFTENTSHDFNINKERLKGLRTIHVITDPSQMPAISGKCVIIDSIFGSGLKRPVSGLAGEIINILNNSGCTKIAIDIPSGLFCEDNSDNNGSILKADFTLTFQFPKLSFFFAENLQYTGDWQVLDIGLHEESIRQMDSHLGYMLTGDIMHLLKKRNRFDHKGKFGHGLLISGSYGKMGAAVMCAEAAMRTGIGLLTCHIPHCGYGILQTAFPEAMVITDPSEKYISSITETINYSSVGIGPGIGTEPPTRETFAGLIRNCSVPLVIDADGLNILSMDKGLLDKLPANSILTPHPGEFERLAGQSKNAYERFKMQLQFSTRFNCIVVLKGGNTSITLPDGSAYFNSTGNPGMATGGSGDVLTGMILSLLAQGYRPDHAAITGVFVHGLAGDIAAVGSYESLIATDIIKCIGEAFNTIRKASNVYN